MIASTSVLEIASCNQLGNLGRPSVSLVRHKTPLNENSAVSLFVARNNLLSDEARRYGAVVGIQMEGKLERKAVLKESLLENDQYGD